MQVSPSFDPSNSKIIYSKSGITQSVTGGFEINTILLLQHPDGTVSAAFQRGDMIFPDWGDTLEEVEDRVDKFISSLSFKLEHELHRGP